MVVAFPALASLLVLAASGQPLPAPSPVEVLVAEGDRHFARAELEIAVDAYQAAIREDPSGPSGLYARFRLGWAQLNLDRPADAMAAFDAVVREGERLASPAAAHLVSEARRDWLLPFSRLSPEEAPRVRAVVMDRYGEQWPAALRTVADQLSNLGRNREAVELWSILRDRADAPALERLALQLEILEGKTLQGQQAEILAAARKVGPLMEASRAEARAVEGELEALSLRAEEQLRALALGWTAAAHRPESWDQARRLLDEYLRVFGERAPAEIHEARQKIKERRRGR